MASVMPVSGFAEDAAGSQQALHSRLGFQPLSWSNLDQVQVPAGYETQVVVGWGDALFADSPEFNVHKQTGAAQERQFGYNNDFIGYVPLAGSSTHGLLCVSFEYTDPRMMHERVAIDQRGFQLTKEQFAIDKAAHGLGVVEIKQDNNQWQVVTNSGYNRRVTADTPMRIAGPAAGAPEMRTSEHKDGMTVDGTVNNCAGGLTPWHTWLQAEENFNGYFRYDPLIADKAMVENCQRYGIGTNDFRGWSRHQRRFDLAMEPNEANRFGWIVFFDPLNPEAPPVKRTALGRFKHEAATTAMCADKRVAVYMGDDQQFEYVYKFVSRDAASPERKENKTDIFDHGILYVARLNEDGSGEWLPLVFGEGPLTAANGWRDQADVLIRTRMAADALGATPMDRPEDVEASPFDGKVYIALYE